MSEYRKVPTSAEVYAVVMARHPNLTVHTTFSDPSGTFMGGAGVMGRMDTERGFHDAPIPIVGIRTTWTISVDPNDPTRHDEQRTYWLCVPIEEPQP